jgi:hypothetical protein
MKSIIAISNCIFLAGIMIFSSCKKETSCESCADKKKPPIAIAGPDQVITLPTDSISLDGSSSKDPDGTISAWLWTKISGPASVSIMRPSDSSTKVKDLVVGVYQFILKVTDNGGLSASDTVQITVNIRVQTNRPPVANAGVDQTITLPTNTVNLDGSGSSDPDNNIFSYAWTKISGPSSFNIANANVVQTQVANLVQGVYQFELKVTDADGVFAIDTIQVTVLPVLVSPSNGILIPFGTLSIARAGIASATAGNKVLFAGGFTTCGTIGSGICNWFSRVDIYDLNTQTWSTAELSLARTFMSVATIGNKIFFAGGYISSDDATSRVDIYDATSNSWSTAELSQARTGVAAASAGNKVFFAGGCSLDGGLCQTPSALVDVYDASTNIWSTTSLSEARIGLAAASVGDKGLFSGGYTFSGFTSTVNIYNSTSNSWTISSLSEAREGIAATTLGTKTFFGGGTVSFGNTQAYSNRVDIYDNSTQSWTIASLSQPAQFVGAASDVSRVLFFPYGNRMEIYNSVSNTWYFSELNQPLYSSSLVGAGGQIYVAGGALNSNYTNYTSQIWRVQF